MHDQTNDGGSCWRQAAVLDQIAVDHRVEQEIVDGVVQMRILIIIRPQCWSVYVFLAAR